jgi:hypothetical protein
VRSRWELDAILEALRHQAWTITQTASGRHRCVPPGDEDIVIVAETKAWIAQQNTLSDLRRSGFVWPSARRRKARRTPIRP